MRGPGITFFKPQPEPFNWAPVLAIGGALLVFALLLLVFALPVLLGTKGIA